VIRYRNNLLCPYAYKINFVVILVFRTSCIGFELR
jgi:hypothetical protein